MPRKMTRRGLVAGSLVGAAGIMGLEERILLAAMNDANDPNKPKAHPPQAESMPAGKIGNLAISRMIIGSNLIAGFAHSRDLIYVSKLFKAYNTDEKIFETLAIAEQHGINTTFIDIPQMDLVNKYKKQSAGKLQTIVPIKPTEDNPRGEIDVAADKGASTIYLHGMSCDACAKKGRIDILQKAIEYIQKKGLQAGIGCHSYYVLEQCRDAKVEPDYWVKTFHHDKYWSAHPKEKREPFSVDLKKSDKHDEIHDNMFCLEPEETIDFFKTEKKPWIAFKTLAAGAITPKSGFKYAFENGADFIAVGMFDFQIAEDVKIVRDVLASTQERPRKWFA